MVKTRWTVRLQGVDEDALPLGVRAMATLAWEFLAQKR